VQSSSLQYCHIHNLANKHGCLTPAKNEEQRYQQCWTNCRRSDNSADNNCLSIA